MPDFGCHVYVRLSQAVGSSWDRSIYFSRLKVKADVVNSEKLTAFSGLRR